MINGLRNFGTDSTNTERSTCLLFIAQLTIWSCKKMFFLHLFCLVGAKTPPGKAIKCLFLPDSFLGRVFTKRDFFCWKQLDKINRKARPFYIEEICISHSSMQKKNRPKNDSILSNYVLQLKLAKVWNGDTPMTLQKCTK